MKKNTFLSLVCILPLMVNGQVHQYPNTANIDIPFVRLVTVNNDLPTCDGYACPPEDCWGACVAVNPNKVKAHLVITRQNDTVYDSGEYEKKTSGLTVKLRGNSASAENVRKKSYKLKLEKKANLIVADAEDPVDYRDKDWVLLNNVENKINQLAGVKVSQLVDMPWTPRCELVQAECNGDYWGHFFLSEAVTGNKDCRIELGDGGYVLELDPYWWAEDYHFASPVYSSPQLHWTYKEPDTDDLTDEWESTIQNQFAVAEQHVTQPDVADYWDFESIAKWMLAQNILGNSDGAGSNIFFCGKDTVNPYPFTMPLLWDFDGAFKCPVDKATQSWAVGPFPDLLSNDLFAAYYRDYFENHYEEVIDQTIAYLDSLQDSPFAAAWDSVTHYENIRWNIAIVPFAQQATQVIDYLQQRKDWMSRLLTELNTVHMKEQPARFYNLLGLEVDRKARGLVISDKGTKRIIVR